MQSPALTRDWVRAGTLALASLFVLIPLLRMATSLPWVDRQAPAAERTPAPTA